MSNGSLLMTSRMDGAPWWPGSGQDHHYNKTNILNRNRGFARSDDGGHTWQEVWYLSARPGDRQAEIGIHDTFVNEALTSSATRMYWAHPQNISRTRSNYTLHSSSNGGASWDFVNRVYGGGAGYSDAIVVPDPAAPGGETLLMAFQKTFTPPVAGIEGGGYDVGLARLPL